MNAQKHLATTATSRETLIVFLKIPPLLEAEAAIALNCFSKANFESKITSKNFNSETISTTVLTTTKSENKGSTVREREMSIILVLLGFTNIPHLQHQSLITAKSSFNDAATDDLSLGFGILQSKVVEMSHNQPAHSEGALEGKQCTTETTMNQEHYRVTMLVNSRICYL